MMLSMIAVFMNPYVATVYKIMKIYLLVFNGIFNVAGESYSMWAVI